MSGRKSSKYALELFAVFIGMGLAAAAIVFHTYITEARHRTSVQLDELASIVQYKSDTISLWLDERRANALSASHVPSVAKDLLDWQASNNAEARRRIEGFLKNLLEFYGFSSIELLGSDGRSLSSVGEKHVHLHSAEMQDALERMHRAHGAQLVDLHRHEDGSVRMGFIAPIHDHEAQDQTPIGILFFGLDPWRQLYPMLDRWPKENSSFEIDLMRPEGGDLLYLSPMKHRPDLLFTKRDVHQAPSFLTHLQMTPDMAPYQGHSVDYRGKRILAAGQPIPGTNWQLLSKVDEDEALAGLSSIAINAGVLAGLTLLIALATLYLFWQRQRLREAESKAALAQKLKISEENYRSIFSLSKVPSLLIDPATGNILSANQTAIDFYGYNIEEFKKLTISDINIAPQEKIKERMSKAMGNETNYFEFRHRLANGDIRDVEIFSGPLIFDEQPCLFSIITDVTERRRLEQKLQEMATTDVLTGLPNRRHFLDHLQDYLNLLARGASHSGSVMMLDLDHFKQVNDTWGHNAGDQVLQQVAKIMLAQLRKVDAPGRIGGEEFAVLLPGVGPEEAMKSAERLRLAIATNPIILSDGTRIDQTISIGITSILSTDLDTKTPLARADKALYQAKNQGRNQSVIA